MIDIGVGTGRESNFRIILICLDKIEEICFEICCVKRLVTNV